jgi:hypothetical protein
MYIPRGSLFFAAICGLSSFPNGSSNILKKNNFPPSATPCCHKQQALNSKLQMPLVATEKLFFSNIFFSKPCWQNE